MNKLLVILLAVLLFCPVTAFAESIDMTKMTREELHQVINEARKELVKFELAAEEDVVLFDENDVKVTLKGYEFVTDRQTLILNTIVENNSDMGITISSDASYLNGWDIYLGYYQTLEPGKKAKNECSIYSTNEFDIESESDLETLEFVFTLVDPESYETLAETDVLTIVFNPLSLD